MTGFRSLQVFFRSTAGRGILAVYLAAVLLVFPPALSWVVAIGLLVFGLDQFWLLLRRVKSQQPSSPPARTPESVALASRPSPHFDVESALQAAQSHDRRTSSSENGFPVV